MNGIKLKLQYTSFQRHIEFRLKEVLINIFKIKVMLLNIL